MKQPPTDAANLLGGASGIVRYLFLLGRAFGALSSLEVDGLSSSGQGEEIFIRSIGGDVLF